MNPKGGRQECPKCGYVEGTPQVLPCLAPGTVLADRYLVGRHTAGNGEGYTYIGLDRKSGRKVDIREYLPHNLSTRRKGSDAVIVSEKAAAVYNDYLSDFKDIAKAVSRLGDMPGILPVLNIFECNNTAYAVYEHRDTKPLAELVRRAKRLTWDEAYPLFMPLISSLSAAHAIGLVHFGISPETVRMTRSGELILTGFGVPDARLAETELAPEIFDGFAAIEQYSIEARKGKWTDVYSISAVMLYALTGKRPPDALTRARDPRLNVSSELAESLPAHVVAAIAKGLQVHAESRTQSIDRLKSELLDRAAQEAPHRSQPEPHREPERPQHRPESSYREEPAPPRRRPEGARPADDPRAAEGGFGGRLAESARSLGGRVSSFISSRRRSEPAQNSSSDNSGPWYQNLKQWQYALLSTCIMIVVLGTIAVIVFLTVRPEISGKTDPRVEPTVQIMQPVTGSDIIPDSMSQTEIVPDLVGKEWNPALESEYIVFQILVVKREYSDDQPEGRILSQTVKKDTELAVGSPIGITVSLGSKNCKVPDITGKTVSEAYDLLESKGLTMGTQTEEFSDTYPAGTVIRLNGTSVGASMLRGSPVNIVISKGPEG